LGKELNLQNCKLKKRKKKSKKKKKKKKRQKERHKDCAFLDWVRWSVSGDRLRPADWPILMFSAYLQEA
jgi:hypothetical protein